MVSCGEAPGRPDAEDHDGGMEKGYMILALALKSPQQDMGDQGGTRPSRTIDTLLMTG